MVYNDDEDDMEKTGHKRKERSRRLKERLERRYSFRMYRSSQRPTNLFTSASGGDLFLSLFFFFFSRKLSIPHEGSGGGGGGALLFSSLSLSLLSFFWLLKYVIIIIGCSPHPHPPPSLPEKSMRSTWFVCMNISLDHLDERLAAWLVIIQSTPPEGGS